MMKDNKELFQDVWGTVSTGRADCFACNGTGQEYSETCVTCGGYGWMCYRMCYPVDEQKE